MPLRILLAEDHLIVRQGVKQLLTREGYSVVAEAADGHEAVRLAQEHCPDLAEVVPQIWTQGSTDDPLTPREREVLQLVAEGKTTKEIAALLGVSFNTAESHRNRIMKKLNVHETAGLVRYAIRQGLTSA